MQSGTPRQELKTGTPLRAQMFESHLGMNAGRGGTAKVPRSPREEALTTEDTEEELLDFLSSFEI